MDFFECNSISVYRNNDDNCNDKNILKNEEKIYFSDNSNFNFNWM